MSTMLFGQPSISRRVKTTLAAGVLALSLSFGLGGFVNQAEAARPIGDGLAAKCRAIQDAYGAATEIADMNNLLDAWNRHCAGKFGDINDTKTRVSEKHIPTPTPRSPRGKPAPPPPSGPVYR